MRRKVGDGYVTQVEAECKYHRDKTDAKSTTCKRAIQFVTDVEQIIVTQRLNHWSILGRTCPNRAETPRGHRFVPWSECLDLGNETLDRLKEFGLAQPSWIVDHPGAAPAAPKAKAVPKAKAAPLAAGPDDTSTQSTNSDSD